VEEPKLTGMIVADLKREIAEKDKEIESLKKEIEGLKGKNKEISDMLEIATQQIKEIKGQA
jgi:chromosome segregation ATPase